MIHECLINKRFVMPKWLSNGLFVLVAFALALYLHLGFGGTNPGLSQNDAVRHSADGALASVDSFRLVGVKTRVQLENVDQITDLWQRFEQAAKLHASLDGTELQTAVAYYDAFDADAGNADLIIGYPESSLTRAVEYPRHDVLAGEYRHWSYAGNDPQRVEEAWQEILAQGVVPQAVLERYAMDAWGQTNHIQVQALLQP